MNQIPQVAMRYGLRMAGSIFLHIAGLFFLSGAVWDYYFTETAVQGEARVLEKSKQTSRDSNDEIQITHYLKVEFTTTRGETVRMDLRAPSEAYWERTLEGDTVPVLYRPASPQIWTRISASRWQGFNYGVIGVSLFLLLWGQGLYRRALPEKQAALAAMESMRAQAAAGPPPDDWKK